MLMTDDRMTVHELESRVRELEAEVARLRAGRFTPRGDATVRVPDPLRPIFNEAQRTVGAYFRGFDADPSQGTIEIEGERYLLIRATSLSYGFLEAIRSLYADRSPSEALHIGKTLLFDMAHVIGRNDARNFHAKTGMTEPLTKLSAGPVHFAYTGWAFVEILPDSHPSPDDDFVISYHHPFSFESDSWLRAGHATDVPVCVMNAGYSSGWCEESFGIPLVATEIACKAKGDDNCTFVMAPPHRIEAHLERMLADASEDRRREVIRDIPMLFERKAIEEQLEDAVARAQAANEAKTLFLANVSHELRTPLTGILGIAHLLLDQDLAPEHRAEVARIDQSGKALLRILNDILDLSKIEAGAMEVHLAPADVRAMLGEVVDLLRTVVAEKGLTLDVHVEADVPSLVRTDSLRVRQILLNLAGNAVKFTEFGGVSLHVQCPGGDVLRIDVRDTGVGIDPATIPDLFEDFTQADASDARRFGGAGLGLGIARRLATLLGGGIEATSVPGRGSTFTLTVPLEPVVGQPEGEEGEDGARVQFEGHVLLAEDDKIARYVVGRLLGAHGLRVDTVENGREAVDAVRLGRYDAVFMDCQMPVMDGYDATARIRALEPELARTPIVAMTASVMQADSERCTAAGMDDFLGKPVDPAQLQHVLSRWLALRPR